MYDSILLPVDGSDGSEAAVAEAVELAVTNGASLRVVYVADSGAFPTELDAGVVRAELEKYGESVVGAVADRAEAAGVETETAVVRGGVTETILRQTREADVDLVVMGTHGRTGVDRLVLGSVTGRVVRRADRPVLVVPASSAERN